MKRDETQLRPCACARSMTMTEL